MTLDELLAELQSIKKTVGGSVEVSIMSYDHGTAESFSVAVASDADEKTFPGVIANDVILTVG